MGFAIQAGDGDRCRQSFGHCFSATSWSCVPFLQGLPTLRMAIRHVPWQQVKKTLPIAPRRSRCRNCVIPSAGCRWLETRRLPAHRQRSTPRAAAGGPKHADRVRFMHWIRGRMFFSGATIMSKSFPCYCPRFSLFCQYRSLLILRANYSKNRHGWQGLLALAATFCRQLCEFPCIFP